jgi:hypothetical protein
MHNLQTSQEVIEMCCTYGEVDGRLPFHSSHAAKQGNDVVIASADTDIFILSLAL